MKKIMILIVSALVATAQAGSTSTTFTIGQSFPGFTRSNPNKRFIPGEFIVIDTIDAQPDHLRIEQEYTAQPDGTLTKQRDYSSNSYEIAQYMGSISDNEHIVGVEDKNTRLGGNPGVTISKILPTHLIHKLQ